MQQVQLIEVKEHQDDILMIGEIQLFLPSTREEEKLFCCKCNNNRGIVTVDDD
jgi:hypothetical protein